jgi:hypothetical protein
MSILSMGCQWRTIPKDLPPRSALFDCFKSRRRLEAEILVLRHRLSVLLDAATIVRPETVVRWHRTGFSAH